MSKGKTKSGEPETEPDGTEPVQPSEPAKPDALTAAAVERLTAAIKDRSLQGYSEVTAGDVVLVGQSIPVDRLTDPVKGLLAGAGNNDPRAAVHQKTEHLAHLLELVKG